LTLNRVMCHSKYMKTNTVFVDFTFVSKGVKQRLDEVFLQWQLVICDSVLFDTVPWNISHTMKHDIPRSMYCLTVKQVQH
jgi:hypothetical protein